MALIAACGGPPGDSGIRGRALVGPTCPVEEAGVACDPLPRPGKFVVRSDGSVVAHVLTGKDGRFTVRLEPRRYVLESESGGFPFLKPVDVVVHEHAFTHVTLTFDSGIR
jgi:hypothetical protein